MGTALTLPEADQLAAHEAVIARGLQTFYAVGTALATIRDARLYRADHATFEDYCQKRWNFTRIRASQLIAASEVYGNVNNCLQPPANEAQARPLASLPATQQAEVWQEAVATAPNGKLTAAHVTATVERLAPRPAPELNTVEYPVTVVPEWPRPAAPALAVHYSSETPEWYTPAHIVTLVRDFFDGIDLDPCSNSHECPNVPARQHFTLADDGLAQPWWGRVYLNPPYGREIGAWIEKLIAADQAREIEAGIALLPARTDTAWFNLLRDCAICFIRGRLTFVGGENAAPFPSMLVYTGDEWTRFATVFAGLGDVFQRRQP